jgi:NAD(P)-dependent dehydrogenase (short-subunit alcohol dehydrogenase family)
VVVGTHLAKRHHPAHLVEAALEQFGGLECLLFMAYSTAPPLASQEVEAWERSVDVNVKGFLYSLAAALPALRAGGGHVIALGAEKSGPPDPLHRAARTAVAVLVEELNAELSEEGVVASVVEERETERYAEAVLRLLTGPATER